MSQPRIIISSPPYSPSVGGIVVLHKLCDILLTLGYDAYLYPLARFHDPNSDQYFVNSKYKYQLPTEINQDIDIVIYPEIQEGNPLGAKNVVRYLLNRYHLPDSAGSVMDTWDKRDFWLYHDIIWYDGFREKNILKIVENKLNIFKNYNLPRTTDACFTYRKKHHEIDSLNIIHPPNSIEIPFTLSDEELIHIFNTCKRFYSYDLETYLNYLAIFCGCESVVVPYKNLTKEEVGVPKYGVAYGLEDLEYANSTQNLLMEQVKKRDIDQYNETKVMFEKIFKYFNL